MNSIEGQDTDKGDYDFENYIGYLIRLNDGKLEIETADFGPNGLPWNTAVPMSTCGKLEEPMARYLESFVKKYMYLRKPFDHIWGMPLIGSFETGIYLPGGDRIEISVRSLFCLALLGLVHF